MLVELVSISASFTLIVNVNLCLNSIT